MSIIETPKNITAEATKSHEPKKIVVLKSPSGSVVGTISGNKHKVPAVRHTTAENQVDCKKRAEAYKSFANWEKGALKSMTFVDMVKMQLKIENKYKEAQSEKIQGNKIEDKNKDIKNSDVKAIFKKFSDKIIEGKNEKDICDLDLLKTEELIDKNHTNGMIKNPNKTKEEKN